MKRLLLTTTMIILGAVSCYRQDSTVSTVLEEIGTYMNGNHAKALTALDSLKDENIIRGKRDNAKFALLYSMALDKNYIDVTDDSLINIAVRWYRHHGSPDEKLKAYYYLGAVQRNAGKREAAMRAYTKAERFAPKAKDDLAIGLLYKAQFVIFNYIYDLDNCVRSAKMAAKHFLAAKDTNKYIGASEDIAENYLAMNRKDSCAAYLKRIAPVMDKAKELWKGRYYSILVSMESHLSTERTLATIQEYLKNVSPEHINWATVAYGYLESGDADAASEAIKNYPAFNEDFINSEKYHLVLAIVNERLGKYKEALEAYKKYISITDAKDMDIFNQNIKSVKDEHRHEMETARNRMLLYAVTSGLITIILCTVIAIIRMRREKERFELLYSQAVIEAEMFSKAIRKEADTKVPRQIINDRLTLLNKFIAAYIANDGNLDKNASQELERLVSDRERFLDSTRMSYGSSCPDLMDYLSEKGLTDKEKNYCCLYLLGLNGKEIGNYIGLQRHYIKYSQPIRVKLGLGEHDKNLGPYLLKLQSDLDSRQ